jgi:hypothetical protein
MTAMRDGELFLFVSDAVLAIHGLYGAFYRNNRGSTRVLICANDGFGQRFSAKARLPVNPGETPPRRASR